MLRNWEIDDWFKVPPGGDGGLYLRRWGMVEIIAAVIDPDTGAEVEAAILAPRCIGEPLCLLDLPAEEEIAAQLAANAQVRALVAASEPEPEPMEVPVYDVAGNQVGIELVVPEAPPPPPAPPRASYRTLRKILYTLRIGGGGDATDGFGNMADAQFWARNGDAEPLAALDSVVSEIKALVPKPEAA